jgi:hypothetical protein
VITGFNTDIEHDGVVYHVQTEDKGLETPIILSLVYSGGAILASKRSRYEDLIASGFSDEVLAERLKRQHRLICAAIHSGRIDDLKKMSGPRPVEAEEIKSVTAEEIEAPALATEAVTAEAFEIDEEIVEPELTQIPVVETVPETVPETVSEIVLETPPEPTPDSNEFVFELELTPTQSWLPPEEVTVEAPSEPDIEPELEEGVSAQEDPYSVYDPRYQPEPNEVVTEGGLVISLLDDEEFHSGEKRTLRVLVANRKADNDRPLANVTVSIKILGTTFRPMIFTLKTQKDGVATVDTEIPEFTSGRAAVLVRAVAKEQAAELRRIIHPKR